MDFGESNPTTLVDLWQHDGIDYYDEIHYEAGFGFDKLMSVIRAGDVRRMVVADPSHETVIRQLGQHGVQIMGVKKFRGSVDGGLAMMKAKPFVVTKRSINLIKELRNYVYERTRSGILLDTPRKYLDHAIDASRYAKLHSSRAFSIK
jgi:phage terminase large subunit